MNADLLTDDLEEKTGQQRVLLADGHPDVAVERLPDG
jgi:hypothetical protein